ncbi:MULTISPECIES: META domain-containing protein [Microbacterium]|uniref:META domain-containing protein n=1 Tax=Microbacterium wangchenii TaxID=2541726 RepID=A0ABX5SXY7_9MICO|nr:MULTISPECIES: META domain-containing protein [Microbacterium]MCK6067382.1 META domain-containing protein [Microbacterium sp. EYE_512]QBR89679.1 META domain-containing protein [Microbacterium wangchenii]TFV81028.1 META domain-containing protein [Microbacterium sp. dk485]TXK16723.1 META domain-containing protein [Microbacterium wangchenii]
MFRRIAFALAVAGVLALAACSQEPAAATGRWGSASDSGPYLELASDGQLFGNDGCNSLGGHWRAESPDTVTFDDVAMTLMACAGQEEAWLGAAGSAKVQGDRLVLFDRDGTEIGSLPRP